MDLLMTRHVTPVVIPLIILPLLGEAIREGWAQDAGVTSTSRNSPTRASTCIIVRSIRPSDVVQAEGGQPARVISYGVKYDDRDRILAKVPTIKEALPIREIPRQIRHRDRTLDGRVVGTTHDYATFARLEIDRGRFLTEADDAKFENHAVIAAGTAQALFPEADPIGQAVKLGADYYTVVGVTKGRAGTRGVEDIPAVEASNVDVYVPLNTCRLRFGERVMTSRGGETRFEECQLSEIVVRVRDGAKVEDAAALIKSTIEPFHPKGDVEVTIGRNQR
jgi:putative ABC transport system permease protein